MKKFIAIVLIFAICCGLCACGTGTGNAEEVALPTAPKQIEKPTQPIQESQSGTDTAVETTEAAEPTEETYPWEAEFNEADYKRIEFSFHGEKTITWREGSIMGRDVRQLRYQSDGSVIDSYYYPSGNTSHSYAWWFDGGFTECHYLDNGYFDKAIGLEHFGTMVYVKTIYADGSWSEIHIDENENKTHEIQQNADGSYYESYFFPDGTFRKTLSVNPGAGDRMESEYFEDQNLKYYCYTSEEYTQEERYDEEGFRTYHYYKDATYKIELTADETGKLVTVVENGEAIEDTAIIAQYAQNYNFKE